MMLAVIVNIILISTALAYNTNRQCSENQVRRTNKLGQFVCCFTKTCEKNHYFEGCRTDNGFDKCIHCEEGKIFKDKFDTKHFDPNSIRCEVPDCECFDGARLDNEEECRTTGIKICVCDRAKLKFGPDPKKCDTASIPCDKIGIELKNNGECRPCDPGFEKTRADNSTCVAISLSTTTEDNKRDIITDIPGDNVTDSSHEGTTKGVDPLAIVIPLVVIGIVVICIVCAVYRYRKQGNGDSHCRSGQPASHVGTEFELEQDVNNDHNTQQIRLRQRDNLSIQQNGVIQRDNLSIQQNGVRQRDDLSVQQNGVIQRDDLSVQQNGVIQRDELSVQQNGVRQRDNLSVQQNGVIQRDNLSIQTGREQQHNVTTGNDCSAGQSTSYIAEDSNHDEPKESEPLLADMNTASSNNSATGPESGKNYLHCTGGSCVNMVGNSINETIHVNSDVGDNNNVNSEKKSTDSTTDSTEQMPDNFDVTCSDSPETEPISGAENTEPKTFVNDISVEHKQSIEDSEHLEQLGYETPIESIDLRNQYGGRPVGVTQGQVQERRIEGRLANGDQVVQPDNDHSNVPMLINGELLPGPLPRDPLTGNFNNVPNLNTNSMMQDSGFDRGTNAS